MIRKGTEPVNSDALGDAERPFLGDGARLAAARVAAGFKTQEKFAKRIGGLARHTVSRWESGAIEVPPRRRQGIAAELGTTVSAIWRSDVRANADGTLSAMEQLSPKQFGAIVRAHRGKQSASDYAPQIGLKLERAVLQLEAGISTRPQRNKAMQMLSGKISLAEIASAGGRAARNISEHSASPGVERVAIDELFAFAKELRMLADRADDTGRALLKQSMIPAEK